MLKITIAAIGKDKDRWVTDGIAHYAKLLSRWASLTFDTLSPKTPSSLSPAEIKRIEADAFRKHVDSGYCVALSDSGESFDSMEFSSWIEKVQIESGGQVTFLIGGPYGLDEAIFKKAPRVISLSPLTFSHQLVRLVLLEQLYRGFSIIHGTDYHK